MRAGRGAAVALALLAALVTAGCGLGPGSGVGSVELTVTRDYGAAVVLDQEIDDVRESDSVLRVLDDSASITTRYGGGFVQSIDGTEAGNSGGRYHDWFFFVNGIESPIGAADYSLRGGERIWWDYRDWTASMRVPAVVGSWPQPFADGYEGGRHPVAVVCEGGGEACSAVRARIAGAAGGGKSAGDPIRVLVGPWASLRADPVAGQIERGPQYSGVFARFEERGPSFDLVGLGADGHTAVRFGPKAGMVAATRRNQSPPVWVVTGATRAGVAAAAELLDEADLRDRYAVVTEGGAETPLPLR